MNCPNCGLANADNAKFCANCGTPLGAQAPTPDPYQSQSQYQSPGAYTPPPGYQAPGPIRSQNSMAKNIGLGCLIALLVVMFLGFSCTRACFGFRHGRTYVHRRY